jgi:hypothetical protein
MNQTLTFNFYLDAWKYLRTLDRVESYTLTRVDWKHWELTYSIAPDF